MISNDVILSPSSLKKNRRSTGLPGKFPTKWLVTIVFPSFSSHAMGSLVYSYFAEASKELLYDEVFISGFVISVNVDPLEFHGRQCPGSAEVCRNADLSPAFCLVCPRCLSLGCELNCVAADQKMCREMVAVSQAENNLCHFCRGANFVPPVRLQSLDNRTYGGFILREQSSCFFVRADPPIRAHSTGF